MHRWGDEGIDFEGIGNAAYEIGEYCRKWGRITCNSKEKYGTVRVYVSWFYGSLHELINPGHYYIRFRKPLAWLDWRIFGPLIRYSRIPNLMHRWQFYIYNRAYQIALRKYPHLKVEILCCADYQELIDGSDAILEQWRKRQEGLEEGP